MWATCRWWIALTFVYASGSAAQGETPSCGTGACAAVVAGIRRGLLDGVVSVATRGGRLGVAWPGPGAAVTMTGPAATVFEGEWEVTAG